MRESRYISVRSEVQEPSSTGGASTWTPEKTQYSRAQDTEAYETITDKPNGRTIDEKESGARSKGQGEKRWKKTLRSMSKQVNKVSSRRMHAKPSDGSKGEIKDVEKDRGSKKKNEKEKTSAKEEEQYTDFEEVDAPMKPAVVEILPNKKQLEVLPGEEAIGVAVVKKPAEKKQGIDIKIRKVKQTTARDRSSNERTTPSVYGFLSSTYRTQETPPPCTERETTVPNKSTLSLPREENRKYYVDLPPYDNPTIRPVSNDRKHSKEEANKGADSTINVSKSSQASESRCTERQPKTEPEPTANCWAALAMYPKGIEFLVSDEFFSGEKCGTQEKPKPLPPQMHVHSNVEVLEMPKEGMEFLIAGEPSQIHNEETTSHTTSKSLPSKLPYSEMSTASHGAAQTPAEYVEPEVHNVSDQRITSTGSALEEKTNPPCKKQRILQQEACTEQLDLEGQSHPKERPTQELQSELTQPMKCTLHRTPEVN